MYKWVPVIIHTKGSSNRYCSKKCPYLYNKGAGATCELIRTGKSLVFSPTMGAFIRSARCMRWEVCSAN